MQDMNAPQSLRLAAATAVAPYIHPRLSVTQADLTPSLSQQERDAAEAASKAAAIDAFERAFGRGKYAVAEPEKVPEPEPVYVIPDEQRQPVSERPPETVVMDEPRVTRLSPAQRRPKPIGSAWGA